MKLNERICPKMKLYKNMLKIVVVVIEIFYYHMNMNLLVLFVDIM